MGIPHRSHVPDKTRSRINELLTAGPPELGPGPRAGVRPLAGLDAELKSILRDVCVPEASRELIRALVLLWHDHLDAAHTISQAIENPDGSLVHAIMHRREPDYWNSKYWWRRAGKHPCFPEIARRVTGLLKTAGERELVPKLLHGGEWDAFAFVDACEAAAGLPRSEAQVRLLRKIQQVELNAALRCLLAT